jgi:excisionase family DNA binding protein
MGSQQNEARDHVVLLIGVREAARRVGLHPDTIYNMIARGEFPHKRIGPRGILRIPVKALEEWARPDAVE